MLTTFRNVPSHANLRQLRMAVKFYKQQLFPNIENLKIFIKFMPYKSNDYGDVVLIGDQNKRREFKITINQDKVNYHILYTLAHEMVHIKQIAKGELKDLTKPKDVVKFHNKYYNELDMDYNDMPWEQEAYNLGQKLCDKFLRRWNKNAF